MGPDSVAPISAAVEVFGDRWTLLILRDVVLEDRRNFRALLLGSKEGIASNILADRLVRLVEAGLLTRGVGRRGQRAKYSLTESAIQAVPILSALADWGRTWRAPDEAPVGPGPSSAGFEARPVADLMADLRRRHLGPDPSAP